MEEYIYHRELVIGQLYIHIDSATFSQEIQSLFQLQYMGVYYIIGTGMHSSLSLWSVYMLGVPRNSRTIDNHDVGCMHDYHQFVGSPIVWQITYVMPINKSIFLTNPCMVTKSQC